MVSKFLREEDIYETFFIIVVRLGSQARSHRDGDGCLEKIC